MGRKVITRLIGGLGNQLFQYAAGKAAADQLSADLIVDTRYVPDADLLARFGVKGINSHGEAHIKAMPPHKSSRLAYLVWRYFGRQPKLLREGKGFDWGQAFPAGSLYLHGYWQRRKIVEAAKLSLQKPTHIDVPARHANEVCVHVRGGDYLTLKSQNQHATLGADYYNQAVGSLQRRLGDIDITLFTNDRAHAQSLKLNFEYRFAAPRLEADAITSLWAMAQFKNVIIANSTFSWWASHLAGPDAFVTEPPELLVK